MKLIQVALFWACVWVAVSLIRLFWEHPAL